MPENKMPERQATQGRPLAERAAQLGPNPANKMVGCDYQGGTRHEGDFSEGRNQTQKKYSLWKPTGSNPGNFSKKV